MEFREKIKQGKQRKDPATGWPKKLTSEEYAQFLLSLSNEERLSIEGLGESQKAEVAYLDAMGYQYEERDVREFIVASINIGSMRSVTIEVLERMGRSWEDVKGGLERLDADVLEEAITEAKPKKTKLFGFSSCQCCKRESPVARTGSQKMTEAFFF